MEIDCDRCRMRGRGCADCVVTVLLGAPPTESEHAATGLPHGALRVAGLAGVDATLADVELDEADRTALRVLADSGLVSPLPLPATMAVTWDRDRRRA
jgi:hypothetical protein